MTAQLPEIDDVVVVEEPLTAKEGWQRFVDHQPDPPDLPDSTALLAMSASDRDKSDDARRTTTRSCRW